MELPADGRLTYRVAEVAQLLGVSKTIVYDWIERGLVPHVQPIPGGTVLIPKAELEAWLTRNTRTKGAS